MGQMAKSLGFKGASSYQRYEDPEKLKEGYLSRDFVDTLEKALAGKGTPRITAPEVWELAGPEYAPREHVYDAHDPSDPDPIDPDAPKTWDSNEGPRGIPSDASAQIDVTAGMGGGGITIVAEGVPGKSGMTFANDVISDYWRLPPAVMNIRPRHIAVIPVQGDSMLPTLVEGDYVFVDTRHRFPSPDGVYAIADEFGGIVVKRLELASRPGSTEKTVRIISDNPKHAPKEWGLDEIQIIGRVMRRFSAV